MMTQFALGFVTGIIFIIVVALIYDKFKNE